MSIKGIRDIKTSTGGNRSNGGRGGVRGIVPGISIGLGGCSARRSATPRQKTGLDDWGGDANQHLVNVGKNLLSRGNGHRGVVLQRMRRLLADVEECQQFCEEKIPGARRMLRKLEAKLADLQKELQ
jgi:hypothetical protein